MFLKGEASNLADNFWEGGLKIIEVQHSKYPHRTL
jgi:hypothetical protein